MSLDEAFAKIVSEREAKLLRPAASQIAVASREYGFIHIYVMPTIDALIASAIVLNVLKRGGVRFALSVTVKPPSTLENPSLLVGYPSSLAEELTARRPSALIGYGEQPQGILHVQVAATNDSSVAALAAAVLSEVAIVGPIAAYALAAGYWKGLDRGKKAEFQGLEKAVIELLKLENRIEELFTVRLFRWIREPTEVALALTADPYLPGLTGSINSAEKFLSEDPRLAVLKGRRLNEAPENALAVLGEKLYELLKEDSLVPRKPSEIIGYTYTFNTSPLFDLREAALALAHYAEAISPLSLASLGLAEESVTSSAYYTYYRSFAKLTAYVDAMIEKRKRLETRRLGKLEIVVLESSPPSLLLTARILHKLGLLPPEAIPVKQCDRGLCSTFETIAQRVSYQQLVELVNSGCIGVLEDGFWAKLNPSQC